MADPLFIHFIREDADRGVSGLTTYRPTLDTALVRVTGSKILLKEYDEAILDVKLQIIAQCVSFVATEGGTFSDREELARGLRADMEKYL